MKIIKQIRDRANPMKVMALNRIATAGGDGLGLRSYRIASILYHVE